MYNFIESIIVAYFKWILLGFGISLLIIFVYNWRRRWLYYYGSKLPGPFALPLLGSLYLVKGPEDVYNFLKTLFKNYPSVVGIWLGPDLYVSTTEPHHLKVLMTRFMDKGNFYHLMSDYFQRALAAAPVDLWRKNRKSINPTFNVSLISTFVEPFVKHANLLADGFEKECGKETDDIYPRVWKCTLDAACETLAQVDPELLRTQDFLPGVFRIEEILQQRFFSPFYHLNIFWKFSGLRKELVSLWKRNCFFIQQVIDLMKPTEEEVSTKKRYLNHLVDLSQTKKVSHDYILEEAQITFFVGTETSAVALSSTLLILAMYPDVQDKISEELASIFENSDRDPTLEDVNRMEYLERVIKETMRFLPPIPFVMRTVDTHLQLDSYVFPAGSKVIIPIAIVHRKEELWPDPSRFDPDRFLPEETEKRPPCSYLPFSYGVRNCIGYRYAMLSMKIILSAVVRRYKVVSSNYKCIDDIDLFIHVVGKAKNGYKVTLERRNK